MKRYCEKCGKEMEMSIFADHFDRNTGAEIKKVEFICPEIKGKNYEQNPSLLMPLKNGDLMFLGHYIYYEDIKSETQLPTSK